MKVGATVGGRMDDMEMENDVLHEFGLHVGVGVDVDGPGDV